MSRKNEIKKDIWKILREVYGIGEDRDITDKQNDFLNKVVNYLDENISLRRKGDKNHPDREIEDNTPLERPMGIPKPVVVVPQKSEPKKTPKKTEFVKKSEPKAEMAKININALPEHLRKYVTL